MLRAEGHCRVEGSIYLCDAGGQRWKGRRRGERRRRRSQLCTFLSRCPPPELALHHRTSCWKIWFGLEGGNESEWRSLRLVSDVNIAGEQANARMQPRSNQICKQDNQAVKPRLVQTGKNKGTRQPTRPPNPAQQFFIVGQLYSLCELKPSIFTVRRKKSKKERIRRRGRGRRRRRLAERRALKSTCGGRSGGQTRRTPAWRSTSAGRWTGTPR
jgi:hypothetical protein